MRRKGRKLDAKGALKVAVAGYIKDDTWSFFADLARWLVGQIEENVKSSVGGIWLHKFPAISGV